MFSKQIIDLGAAIAHAEGFGVLDAVPTRAHNPGDLKIPGWTGPTTGTEGISVLPDDQTGWNYLYEQLFRIESGNSHIYKTDMSFHEFAGHWTDTQDTSWLDNVIEKLQELGYDVYEDTVLGDFFNMNP